MDAAAGHRLAGADGHLQRRPGTGPGVVAQQVLDHHRRRELRRPAEAAVPLVEVTAEPDQRLVQLGLPGRRVHPAADRVDGGPLGQVRPDPPGDLADLLPPVPPGRVHALQHLPERGHAVPGLGREVGAEVERLLAGGQEHGHRPAPLPGRRLDRLHVDGVDVRPLLPVDLDGDEPLVEVRRRAVVLEGLVGHHMAPVARCVAN